MEFKKKIAKIMELYLYFKTNHGKTSWNFVLNSARFNMHFGICERKGISF